MLNTLENFANSVEILDTKYQRETSQELEVKQTKENTVPNKSMQNKSSKSVYVFFNVLISFDDLIMFQQESTLSPIDINYHHTFGWPFFGIRDIRRLAGSVVGRKKCQKTHK